MRKWVTRIVLAVAVLLLVSQLIPVHRSNSAVDPAQSIYSAEQVPPAVKAVFQRSCENCHSEQTTWPWYAYVAPASWVVANDVHEARKAMNFSRWTTYSAKKREEHLEDICEQVTNGDMPDAKYLLIHRKARLTPVERTAVCEWTEGSRQY